MAQSARAHLFEVWGELKQILLGSRRGVRDVIISMIPPSVRLVTGFVTSVLIARGLGPARLGQYALAISLAETAGQLSDLGIGQTAVRYAARAVGAGDRDGQLAILRWAFRVRLSLELLVILVLSALAPVLAIRVWRMQELTPLLRLGLAPGVFGALSAVPIMYFQSLKRFDMNAIVMVGQALISFAGILLLAVSHAWSVQLVLVVGVVVAAAGAVVFLSVVPRAALVPPSGLAPMTRANLVNFWRSPTSSTQPSGALDDTSAHGFALFMVLSSVIVMLSLKADVWLMGYYLDARRLGVYSAATRFTLPLVVVLNALNVTLWPRVSHLAQPRDIRRLMRKMLKISLVVALPGVIYSFVIPQVAPLLFGTAYAQSVLPAQLLCLGYCVAILICPMGVIGYSLGLVRVNWLVNLVQLAVVVCVLVLLLPRVGVVGAALAFVANATVGGVIQAFVIRSRFARVRAESAG